MSSIGGGEGNQQGEWWGGGGSFALWMRASRRPRGLARAQQQCRRLILRWTPGTYSGDDYLASEMKSALLMGDGNLLTLAQIKKLPNLVGGVQVLTLSACNTGVGDNAGDGKEVEGFGVLAQRQGAKAVIASLWPVADASTSRLKRDFYRIRESGAGRHQVGSLTPGAIRFTSRDRRSAARRGGRSGAHPG